MYELFCADFRDSLCVLQNACFLPFFKNKNQHFDPLPKGPSTLAVRSSAAPYFVTSAALFFGHFRREAKSVKKPM